MIVHKGATDVSAYFYIVQDAGATSPGEPKTGLAFGDLTSASFARQGAARVAITLKTLASASAAHDDGGFIEVDATNMPGVYRLDPQDAAFAAGVDLVTIDIVPGNDAVCAPLSVDLTGMDLQDAVRGGMTALPNAAADAAGGLPISDLGGLDLDALNTAAVRLTAARAQVLDDWIDAGRLDLILDLIAADTDELQTDDIPGTLATIVGYLDTEIAAIKAVTDNIPDSGALTALLADLALILADTGELQTDDIPGLIAALENLSSAGAQSAANAALVALHLDHLLAVTYDPASKPGVADALFNEVIESDGGVSRLTANALEQAPTGSSNPNVLLAAEIAVVNTQTEFTLATGSDEDDAYKDQAIVLYDDSNSDFPCVRVITGYVGATKTVTIDSAPEITLGTDDSVRIFVTAPGTSAPTVGQIRAEMDTNSTQFAAIVADTDEIQQELADGGRTDLLIDAIKAVTDALPDGGALTTLLANVAAIKAVTDNLPDSGALTTLLGNVTAILEDTGTTLPATLATIAGYLDTEIAAIKAVTDNLPDSGALTTLPSNVAAILTDTGTTLPATLATILADTGELQADWADGGRLDLLMDAVKAVTDALTVAAAAKLALSVAGIESGAAEAGTLSTTQMTTNLTEATDDHYKGAVVVWTSGVLNKQRSDITAYLGSTGMLTYTALTEAPSATDTFVIL